MLPGKKYLPEDFLRMAWNRKWLILVPTVVVAAGTAIWSQFLPDRYRSQTTILIVPQRVPENYVRSTVTTRVDERLTIISQQIFSRTRLERIIDEFNLYEEERRTHIMEDVIQRMRSDIDIDITASRRRQDDSTSFTVAFEASNPRMAMQVTERLASLFVRENLEDREMLADATNQFLESQLETARRDLIEHEKRLQDYRQRFSGQLPSQVDSNLQALQGFQTRLGSVIEELNRDQDRSLALEREIADLTAAAESPEAAIPVAGGGSAQAPLTFAQQLENAKVQLRALELRYTPEHPRIKETKGIIAELEVKAAEEARQVSATGAPVVLTSGQRLIQTRIGQARQELNAISLRLASNGREKERLEKDIALYRTRIEAAPARESELTELMRDYDTLSTNYTTLLSNSRQSQIAVDLERRQIGEQFKILDNARLPERPFSPNRARYNLMGLMAGLGLGLGMVALLEYRDRSLKTDSDVSVVLGLPVLAVIPTMTTPLERRRQRRRRQLFALSAAVLAVVAVVAVLRFVPGIGRAWGA